MKLNHSEDESKFPPGRFNEGDRVRLRRPTNSKASFLNPRGTLRVARVLYFRPFAAPTYALVDEEGGLAVVPFKDADLRRARPAKANGRRPRSPRDE